MLNIPGLGKVAPESGFVSLTTCSDGHFREGQEGVEQILSTGDRKLELIAFKERTLAYIPSALGYPAYYPVFKVDEMVPITGVLMDLDGTTVHSESFWIWIIEQVVSSLLKTPSFSFKPQDIPFVSGHSVSEHLEYCLRTYCPNGRLETARELYYEHTRREMAEIAGGGGRPGAFTPAPGIGEFLRWLKAEKIKIGLVTSGLYEKAYPEIVSAFNSLGLGKPEDFYDSIITAGFPLGQGQCGTLGELEAKPHPWLYSESGRVALGTTNRSSILGIEDSGAGACAVRLAGYYTVGIAGGNIIDSGCLGMCHSFCNDFREIKRIIMERNNHE